MDHLTGAQIGELRGELETALRKLERSMKATEEAARPVELDQTAVGRLSRIDAIQSQGLARNLQEREQAKLAHVLEAFRRLEQGSYGLCVDCGAEIPFPRLYVFPEAPSCASCADAA